MKKCLNAIIIIGVFAGFLFPQRSFAQLAIVKPLHLRHVQGYVTDEKGNAVRGAKVVLLRDGEPVFTTKADQFGWFQIDGASGRYVLNAWVSADEAGRDVVVGTNLFTLFCHKSLYVMVRTEGSCMDCSIRVYTSKKQFFNTVWRNTGHYD